MSELRDAAEEAAKAELRAKAEASGKDPDLAELEILAAKVHAAGHDFRIEGGKVIAGLEPHGQEVRIDLGKQRVRIGVAGDTHLGSKYEQLSALRHFYRYADGHEKDPYTGRTIEPVDLFVSAGDVHDGPETMHKGRVYELRVLGADAQVAYAALTYPKPTHGQHTKILGGNHDVAFEKDAGTNVCRQLAGVRDDIDYIGHTSSYLTIGRLKIFIHHPSGGVPYAKSYRPQRIMEGLPLAHPVNIALIGHLHSYCVVQHHGMTGFLTPCFQRQYPYLAGKGLYPTIGGIILDVYISADGKSARVAHELIHYQPVEEDDWDMEASHEVEHGWRPEGHVEPLPAKRRRTAA